MITFQLENKDAEAMVAMLNASGSHASFMDSLNVQFDKQTAALVQIEEPAAFAAFMADEPHEQFTHEDDK
jgi:hypothetical protein